MKISTVLIPLCLSVGMNMFASPSTASDDDFLYHLPSDHYQTVDITINDMSIAMPVIKFASQQAISKGFVLIVADLEAKGNARLSMYEAAKRLPQWGWNTLYVIPQRAHFIAPVKVEEDTPQNDGDTTDENADNTNDSQTADENSPDENNPDENSPDENNPDENSADENSPDEQETQTVQAEQTGLKPFQLQAPALDYDFAAYQQYQAQLLQQLQTVFMQQPGYKILMAQGKSAAAAISLLSSHNKPAQVDQEQAINFNALVVTNIYWPSPEVNTTLSIYLAHIQQPVLDITSASDNSWAMKTRGKRRIASRVELKPLYRQRDIIGVPLSRKQVDYLSKEIIGWTTYMGW